MAANGACCCDYDMLMKGWNQQMLRKQDTLRLQKMFVTIMGFLCLWNRLDLRTSVWTKCAICLIVIQRVWFIPAKSFFSSWGHKRNGYCVKGLQWSMLACCSMLPKQHVAAVLSVYVCLLGRESERRGADVDGLREQNKRAWIKGEIYKMRECMTESRWREGGRARGKRGRL